jgi:hypothetical protein
MGHSEHKWIKSF